MKLNIEHLSKSFKDKVIFNDLNLTFSEKELIHIKGPNGSGKSTLFKMIIGEDNYQKGKIEISDDTYIGALIENPAFFEFENAKDNLKFLAQIRKNYNESKIRKLFSDFDLNYDNRQSLRKYSLGMREKVGIIQAIMENQNLILLDEPTRGLDEESIESFTILINSIISNGKTVVIASHDIVNGLDFSRKLLFEDQNIIEV